MILKEWLALRRWRFLWATIALAAFRLAAAPALRIAGNDDLLPPAALTAWNLAIAALAVAALIAFVQHGRIYRARTPTE